ncbi:hypothetical protein F4825DRAFT_416287 [Nemania diffusa]|nr:hypothetical protein F4825DRAFT_416287 [Nemania diffusa]
MAHSQPHSDSPAAPTSTHTHTSLFTSTGARPSQGSHINGSTAGGGGTNPNVQNNNNAGSGLSSSSSDEGSSYTPSSAHTVPVAGHHGLTSTPSGAGLASTVQPPITPHQPNTAHGAGNLWPYNSNSAWSFAPTLVPFHFVGPAPPSLITAAGWNHLLAHGSMGAPYVATNNSQGVPDDLAVCVICGGICKETRASIYNNETPNWMRATLVSATPNYLEWQKERGHSTRRSTPDDAKLIQLIQPTDFTGGSRGMKQGPRVLPMDTEDPLMRIPIHKTCVDIARRFCKAQAAYELNFRSPSGGAPSSLSHLYEIWCKRAIATCPDGPLTKPILEANLYFGAPSATKKSVYYLAFDADPSLKRFHACPLPIPNLTRIVVNNNLQTIDGKEMRMRDDLAQLWRRCQELPQELFDHVLQAVMSFDEDGGPPLEPTRVLPPSWWKAKLFSGELIPWLWDLEEDDLEHYRLDTFYEDPKIALQDKKAASYVFDESMWDWEFLCRQLAQPNVLEKGGLLGHSQELWNRRRIWRLLDVARLGHLLFP